MDITPTDVATPSETNFQTPLSTLRRVWLWFGRIAVFAALLITLYAQRNAIKLFADHAATVLPYPYQLNYGEGPLLDQTMRLSRGEEIYHNDLSTPPFTIANYPPLYLIAQLPFVQAYGAAFWYGRALSLASSILAALLIGLTIRNVTRDWLAALVGGLTWFAFPYTLQWSPLNRIDTFALMLSWAALFFVTLWPRKRRGLLLAALFLTAAAFTRQTYLLAAPLAAFVYLFMGHKRRLRAIILALLTGCLVLILFDVLLVLTRGGIVLNLITANANAILPETIELYVDEITRHMPIFLGGAALLLLSGLRWRTAGWWLAAPYFIGGLAVAFTIGKIGSDVNYLYELAAAFCLVAGVLIGSARRIPLLRVALLLLLAVQIMGMQHLTRERYYDTLISRAGNDRTDDIERLREIIGEHETVITDEFMGLLPVEGQTIQFQPFELSQMAQDGTWDESVFLDLIASKAYEVIMIYQPARYPTVSEERWTQAMRNQINQSYRPMARVGETTVYQPKD
jgi:hypothetical protein